MCFVSFHCNCNLKYFKKWNEYANIRYNLLPPCLYALYICSSPLSCPLSPSSSPLSGSRAPPPYGPGPAKGNFSFLKKFGQQFGSNKTTFTSVGCMSGYFNGNSPTSQRFTASCFPTQLKSRQNSTKGTLPCPPPYPPNAHLPQASPLHYSISLALLASLQPLSQANHLQL